MSKLKGSFKTIADVWAAIDSGETVYCGSESYRVYVESDLTPEITEKHEGRRFSARNGRLLSVRCVSNYFGSIIYPQDLTELFTRGSGK